MIDNQLGAGTVQKEQNKPDLYFHEAYSLKDTDVR